MKLVLEEYIKTLKEKDELDTLICNLLSLDGYTVYNYPKTGERQYGVDILAKKGKITYLFVVKQKDIDRKSWDSNQNSVRQSLNDIIDVYLETMLPEQYNNDYINIVVATNGYLLASVQQNFNGFQRNHTNFHGTPLNFKIWNIDDLVHLCERVAFSEVLFESNVQSLLRKSLYFMDESNYSKVYSEKVINHYISLLKSGKNIDKIFCSFFTCTTIMTNWAINLERYKIAIDITEYCLIKIWSIMLEYDCFEKSKYVIWLNKFINLYEHTNELFVSEIKNICEVKNGLLISHDIENRILIYDIFGRLSVFGLYLSYSGNNEETCEIYNMIITLLNNNQQYKYPVFDNSIIELSFLFLLVKKCCPEQLKIIIQNMIIGLKCTSKYPSPNDKIEEALDIYSGFSFPNYNASILFSGLLEWICCDNMVNEYKEIGKYICERHKNVTCQTWQMVNSEELSLYSDDYAHKSGACVVFPTNIEIEKFRESIKIAENNINFDEFSFAKYSFKPIALISTRYFHQPLIPGFWRNDE